MNTTMAYVINIAHIPRVDEKYNSFEVRGQCYGLEPGDVCKSTDGRYWRVLSVKLPDKIVVQPYRPERLNWHEKWSGLDPVEWGK